MTKNLFKYLFSLITYYFCKKKKEGFVVLTFHRVLPPEIKYFREAMVVSTEIFDEVLSFLSKNANVISLREAIRIMEDRGKFPLNAVVITFDDGYCDNYKYAFPLLKKYNFPATIFLTTGPLDFDIPLWWDNVDHIVNFFWDKNRKVLLDKLKSRSIGTDSSVGASAFVNSLNDYFNSLESKSRKKELDNFFRWGKSAGVPVCPNIMLTWDMVHEMTQKNIFFEPHTVTHTILDDLEFAEVEHEITVSRDRIRDKTGNHAYYLAVPRGRNNISPQIRQVIKDEMKALLTTDPGVNCLHTDRYKLKRNDIKLLLLDGKFDEKYFQYRLQNFSRR